MILEGVWHDATRQEIVMLIGIWFGWMWLVVHQLIVLLSNSQCKVPVIKAWMNAYEVHAMTIQMPLCLLSGCRLESISRRVLDGLVVGRVITHDVCDVRSVVKWDMRWWLWMRRGYWTVIQYVPSCRHECHDGNQWSGCKTIASEPLTFLCLGF